MMQLSPPASRIVALGLLGCVLAAFYVLIIRPVWSIYAENREAIAQQEELLTRYQRFAAARPELERRLRELRARNAEGEGYLAGDNETLVAAQLQSRVRNLAQASGARLTSTQVLSGVDDSGFRRIGIRVTMTADTPQVQKTFYALEKDRPYLFLDNIDVAGDQGRRRGGSAPEDDELTVSFDVYGFMRAAGAPGEGGAPARAADGG
jgi:hypothetical protein